MIKFDEGWAQLKVRWVEPCFTLFSSSLPRELKFTSAEIIDAYTICYRMCTQRSPHNFSPRLYKAYQMAVKEYVSTHVVPGFDRSATDDRALLQELAARWMQHLVALREFARPFHYLTRYYIPASRVPTLEGVGDTVFRDLVCRPLKQRIAESLIALGRQAYEDHDEGTAMIVGRAYRVMQAVDPLAVDEVTVAWAKHGLREEEVVTEWGTHDDHTEPLLRGVLPLGPSQGAYLLRFKLHKLRMLSQPPTRVTHTPSPTLTCSDSQPLLLSRPATPVTPPLSPVSSRCHREDGPPTKLSRTAIDGSFSSFPSASSTSSSSASLRAGPITTTTAPTGRVSLHTDGTDTSLVLQEVVLSLNHDLFRELMDTCFVLPAR